MKNTLTFILAIALASCAHKKETAYAKRILNYPPHAIASFIGDTLEIIPNEIMYVKIAGTIYQVEAAGRWHRMVYYKGDCDGRNRMKHGVNAADLKCDPYYKAFEPDTCCFCDDTGVAAQDDDFIYGTGTPNGIYVDTSIAPGPAIDIMQFDTVFYTPRDGRLQLSFGLKNCYQ